MRCHWSPGLLFSEAGPSLAFATRRLPRRPSMTPGRPQTQLRSGQGFGPRWYPLPSLDLISIFLGPTALPRKPFCCPYTPSSRFCSIPGRSVSGSTPHCPLALGPLPSSNPLWILLPPSPQPIACPALSGGGAPVLQGQCPEHPSPQPVTSPLSLFLPVGLDLGLPCVNVLPCRPRYNLGSTPSVWPRVQIKQGREDSAWAPRPPSMVTLRNLLSPHPAHPTSPPSCASST